MRLLHKLIRDDRGQDLAEYGIALAVIVVGVGLIAAAIGGNVNTLWANSQPTLQTVLNAEP